MTNNPDSNDYIQDLAQGLANAIRTLRSLDEITSWLGSRQGIKSVILMDYVIKTDPPQKEFVVTYTTDDGANAVKVIDILLLSNDRFALGSIHDR